MNSTDYDGPDTYHGSNLDRYYPHGVIGHATTDHMIWRKK